VFCLEPPHFDSPHKNCIIFILAVYFLLLMNYQPMELAVLSPILSDLLTMTGTLV
jgi:hypothetical protein